MLKKAITIILTIGLLIFNSSFAMDSNHQDIADEVLGHLNNSQVQCEISVQKSRTFPPKVHITIETNQLGDKYGNAKAFFNNQPIFDPLAIDYNHAKTTYDFSVSEANRILQYIKKELPTDSPHKTMVDQLLSKLRQKKSRAVSPTTEEPSNDTLLDWIGSFSFDSSSSEPQVKASKKSTSSKSKAVVDSDTPTWLTEILNSTDTTLQETQNVRKVTHDRRHKKQKTNMASLPNSAALSSSSTSSYPDFSSFLHPYKEDSSDTEKLPTKKTLKKNLKKVQKDLDKANTAQAQLQIQLEKSQDEVIDIKNKYRELQTEVLRLLLPSIETTKSPKNKATTQKTQTSYPINSKLTALLKLSFDKDSDSDEGSENDGEDTNDEG